MHFSFGKKNVKDSNYVVVGFGATSVYFYTQKKDQEFIEKQVADATEYAKVVEDVFTSLNLSPRTKVKAVLLKGLYSPIQIDKPKAPDEELAGAVQWAIKDYVQDTVTNFAIDYIDMPKSPSYPNDKILVISAQKRIVKYVIDAIAPRANLLEISVEEVALADLYTEEDEQAHLILFQPNGYDLNLITIWHSRLFFSRSLRGFKDLYKYQKGSLDSEMFDSLSLELQRSLDYMVAQLKLPNPKLLTIALDCPDRDAIADYLATTYAFKTNLVTDLVGKNSVIYLSTVALSGVAKQANQLEQKA